MIWGIYLSSVVMVPKSKIFMCVFVLFCFPAIGANYPGVRSSAVYTCAASRRADLPVCSAPKKDEKETRCKKPS